MTCFDCCIRVLYFHNFCTYVLQITIHVSLIYASPWYVYILLAQQYYNGPCKLALTIETTSNHKLINIQDILAILFCIYSIAEKFGEFGK